MIVKIEDETDFKDKKIVVAEDLLKSILEIVKLKNLKKFQLFLEKILKGLFVAIRFLKLDLITIFLCWKLDL